MNNDNTIRLVNEHGKQFEYGRIPQVNYVASWLKNEADFRKRPELETVADEILQVWHMAHHLKEVIEGQGEARILFAVYGGETSDPDLPRPDHWLGYSDYPIRDWQYEVSNGDTRLGYHDWHGAQITNAQS